MRPQHPIFLGTIALSGACGTEAVQCPMDGGSHVTYTFDDSTDVDWYGDIEEPSLGETISALGDVDGDGYADFGISGETYVGAWEEQLYFDPTASVWVAGYYPGSFLIPGSASPVSTNLAANVDLWGAGEKLQPAGDFNGDGLADLLCLGVGDPYVQSYQVTFGDPDLSQVFPERSATSEDEALALLEPYTLPAFFPSDGDEDVIPIPDLDGDGRGEIFYTTYEDGGLVREIVGGNDSPAEAAKLFVIEAEYMGVGDTSDLSVGSAGDLDGDGVLDLAWGELAPESSDEDSDAWAAAARVVLGPLSGEILRSEDADLSLRSTTGSQSFGAHLAIDGDADGDGYGDLLTSDLEVLVRGYADGELETAEGRVLLFGGGHRLAWASDEDADLRLESTGGERTECGNESYRTCAVGRRLGFAGEVDGRPGDEIWASGCGRHGTLTLWAGADLAAGQRTPAAVIDEYYVPDAYYGFDVKHAAFADADADGRNDWLVPTALSASGEGSVGATLLFAQELMP